MAVMVPISFGVFYKLKGGVDSRCTNFTSDRSQLILRVEFMTVCTTP